jgi:DNA-binding PadR family transcriptional regulator
MAVSLAESLQQRRYLVARIDSDREFDVTATGAEFLRQWRIDVNELRSKKRSFARRCLDWTERRDHLAGALGATICQRFLELRWIARDRNSRIVRVTPSGRRQLEELIHVPATA